MLLTHPFRSAALALLGCLAFPTSAPAAMTPTPTPGGLLVAQGRFGGRLEIESHDVSVTIRDGIAVTTFEEVFRNTESRELEALYTFPVPKGASVASFSMWINGKEMIGEVVEKERAREIYESYKKKRVDPGLLEQIDNRTFEMRIYPILANAEQRIRVTYYQELDFDADWATYTYPLASSTSKGSPDSQVHGRFSLNLEVLSEIPIKRIESPSHESDFVWVQHSEHYNQASLEQTGGDLSRDIVLSFQTKRAQTGIDLVASTPPQEDGFFQVTLTAGDELAVDDQGMDYVFLSDISGSMKHRGKLGLSNGVVEAFLSELQPNDRVQLISFSVRADPAFAGLQDLSSTTVARAIEFLAEQRAKGGTELLPALRLAYDHLDPDRQLNVVVLSDGLTEEPQLSDAIRSCPVGARVFCVGIGNDVNRPLLTQLARDAGGQAEFFSKGDRYDRRAQNFRRKLKRPALEDVSIKYQGGATYDTTVDRIGNLFHGSPIRIYGRYGEAGAMQVTLSASLAGRPYERVFAVKLPRVAHDHPEIERMWAWNQIQRLEDRIRGENADDRTIDDIVFLSEGFSIPSRYASFLVLENNEEFELWKIERRNVTRVERDREAQGRLRKQLNEMQRVGRDAGRKPGTSTKVVSPDSRKRTPSRQVDSPQQRVGQPLRTRQSGGGSMGLIGLGLAALLAGAFASSQED